MENIAKSTTIFFLLISILLISAIGCSVRKPDYAKNIGESEAISENDIIAVTSATFGDSCILVTIDANLNTLKLQDFERIFVVKSEANSIETECNIQETNRYNSTEIFSSYFNGAATLCFKSDNIISTDNISEYLLCFNLVHADGTASTYKFLLG